MSFADAFRLIDMEKAIKALQDDVAELRQQLERKANKPGRPPALRLVEKAE